MHSVDPRRSPAARPRPSRILPLALLAVLATAGCETMELAYGEVNDIYVATSPELWAEIEDTLQASLEPTVQTVVDEQAMDAVPLDPAGGRWTDLRKVRQLLLIGTRDDPWMQDALTEAGEDAGEPPTFFHVYDLWARNQLVTVMLLPPDDRAGAVAAMAPEVGAWYDRIYREWALSRMFVTGPDTALADTLAREAGFSILVPQVYQWDRQDSTWIFRNDNPSPDELIRQVAVTWRSPIPGDPGRMLQAEPLLEWRDEVIQRTVTFPHDVDLRLLSQGAMRFRGHQAYQVQAVWQNPPEAEWPAAGPFILRAIACPAQDRLYLLDGWLYAPGQDKYQYMIQLGTILDSFRCDGEPARETAEPESLQDVVGHGLRPGLHQELALLLP